MGPPGGAGEVFTAAPGYGLLRADHLLCEEVPRKREPDAGGKAAARLLASARMAPWRAVRGTWLSHSIQRKQGHAACGAAESEGANKTLVYWRHALRHESRHGHSCDSLKE